MINLVLCWRECVNQMVKIGLNTPPETGKSPKLLKIMAFL